MARYVNPVPYIQDGNGDPIVGAKLFFFEPGTTTNKTIYTNSDLTIAASNPQISDSNGRYNTQDIFLDGIYKVVQQDNSGTASGFDGVTIWTKDPVGEIITGQWEIWLNAETYNIPDIVLGSDDEYYRSITDANQGNDPTLSPANWEKLKLGRDWNTNVTYSQFDTAYGTDGLLYTSKTNSNSGNNPVTNTANWNPSTGEYFREGADVASAATTEIWASDGSTRHITGTTTITSFGTAPHAGDSKRLIFDGALILTHGANLNLPGGANITTAAGDSCIVYADTTTQHDVFDYTRSTGYPLEGTKASQGTSLVLIEAQTASSSTSIDFVTGIDSTYDQYIVHFVNAIPSIQNNNFYFRTSTDGGSTFDSSATYACDAGLYVALFLNYHSNATQRLVDFTAANGGISGHVVINNPSDSAVKTSVQSDCIVANDPVGANYTYRTFGHIKRNTAEANDAIRFLFTSGNIVSGDFYLYGVKKS